LRRGAQIRYTSRDAFFSPLDAFKSPANAEKSPKKIRPTTQENAVRGNKEAVLGVPFQDSGCRKGADENQ
jgi:hypothetical protein